MTPTDELRSFIQAFGQDLRALFADFQEINPLSLQDALGEPPSASPSVDAADQQVTYLPPRPPTTITIITTTSSTSIPPLPLPPEQQAHQHGHDLGALVPL